MPSRLTVVLVSLLFATPAFISWLWLVTLPHRVTKYCPKECWCDIGGYFVDCSNKALYNIPSIYFTHVQILLLSDNEITSLAKDSFISKGLTDLENLNLDKCGLQTIELGAFNGLAKLTYLSMNSNQLLKLHPDLFVGLPKFEALSLRSNEGLQIPTDRHFITSRSLKFLHISHCNVGSVSVETFANVRALERLELNHNNLRSIDINILRSLPKLSALPLYYNPLQCDCQLQEVWRWCQVHNIETDHSEARTTCDTPRNVWGVDWAYLEDLQCLKDNISNKDEYKQKHTNHRNDVIEELYIMIVFGLLALLILCLLIFGTICHFIILIIITCNKDMRTVPNMYILNLVINHVILLTSGITWKIVEFNSLKAELNPVYRMLALLGAHHILPVSRIGVNDEFKCMFLSFCSRMSVGLSVYSVAVLIFQRYRVTMKPFQVSISSQTTWRVAVATNCGVWIVAALFAIPSALSKFLCFDLSLELKNLGYYQRVVTFEFFVSCVFPLPFIAFALIMAARPLVESSCPVSEETENPQMNIRKNDEKIVIGLSVVFLITYVPFHIMWTHIIFSPLPMFTPFSWKTLFHVLNYFYYMKEISFCFPLINSCLNPVAIFCTSALFRRHLKRYLRCCFNSNSPPTDIDLTRRK